MWSEGRFTVQQPKKEQVDTGGKGSCQDEEDGLPGLVRLGGSLSRRQVLGGKKGCSFINH